MKRFLKTAFFVLPCLVIAMLCVLYFSINWIARSGVEKFGPKLTQTRVRIEGLDISPLSGKGVVRGILIENPDGFETENAIKLEEVRVTVDLASLFSERFVIKEIVVRAPEITYETNGNTNNIKIIFDNVRSFARDTERGAGVRERREFEKRPTWKNRRVQINRFVVRNARINMSETPFGGGRRTLSMGEVHLRNIGAGEDGKTVSEVFGEIFEAMNRTISGTVSDMEDSRPEGSESSLMGITGRLRELLGR
jgi:hypothetical protein